MSFLSKIRILSANDVRQALPMTEPVGAPTSGLCQPRLSAHP